MKALQPPEVKLYLKSIIFYFKSLCTIYVLHKTHVLILKMFLDKIQRKLKGLGTPACPTLKPLQPPWKSPPNFPGALIMCRGRQCSSGFNPAGLCPRPGLWLPAIVVLEQRVEQTSSIAAKQMMKVLRREDNPLLEVICKFSQGYPILEGWFQSSKSLLDNLDQVLKVPKDRTEVVGRNDEVTEAAPS